VKGHGPGQEVLVLGKENVGISAVEQVGQYAVKLVFDDGHDTGLYTWKYLHELGREQAVRWARLPPVGAMTPTFVVPRHGVEVPSVPSEPSSRVCRWNDDGPHTTMATHGWDDVDARPVGLPCWGATALSWRGSAAQRARS